MKNSNVLSTLLRKMGLSDLEAKVYIWLLENKRSTGYKIAVQIGKPVANTYKALRSLEKKGAVVCDNSSNKTYFDTIPVEEFLNKIERQFIKQRKKIIDEVKKLDVQQEPIGIYELRSAELVYEKAIGMIKTAESSLVIDCFPAPLQVIKKELLNKKGENIPILLKNYCDTRIKGIRQIETIKTDILLDEHLGQWLLMIKDAAESLIAFFDLSGEELLHSVWIKDPFISLILFNGSTIEFNLSEIFREVYSENDNKIENIKQVIRSYQSIYELFMIAEKNIFRRK